MSGGPPNVSDLEMKLARAELDAERFKFEKVQMESKISLFETTMRNLESSESKLQEELTEYKEKNQRLKTKVYSLKKANADSLKESQVALEKIRADKKSLKAEMSKLKECNLKSEGALEECRAENQRLDKEKSQLRNEKERLENELKDGRTEVEEVKKENISLKESLGAELEQIKDINKILKSEISDYKLKSESDMEECREKSQRMVAELKIDKERLENELEEIRTELEVVKMENKSSKESLEAELEQLKKAKESLGDENQKVAGLFGVKKGNPVVFFDMTLYGAPVGTIVMELYADRFPELVEIFRALCVGEKLIPETDKRIGYKGLSIFAVIKGHSIMGTGLDAGPAYHAEYMSVRKRELTTSPKRTDGKGTIMYGGVCVTDTVFIINGTGHLQDNVGMIGRVIQGLEVVDAKSFYFHETRSYSQIDKGTFVIANCGQLF